MLLQRLCLYTHSQIYPLSTTRGILYINRFLLSKISIKNLSNYSKTDWATHYITIEDVVIFLDTLVKHPAVATHFQSYSQSHIASIRRRLLAGRYSFHEYKMIQLESKSDLSPPFSDFTLAYFNKTYRIVNNKADILVAIAVSSLIYKQMHCRNMLHHTYFHLLNADKFISEVESWGSNHSLYVVDIHRALNHVDREKVKRALTSCLYADTPIHHLLHSFLDRLPSIESRSLPIFNRKGIGLSQIFPLSEVLLPLGENIDYIITTLLEQQGILYHYARYNFTSFIALPNEVDTDTHRKSLDNIKSYLQVASCMWTQIEWVKPGGPTVYFRRGQISINNGNEVQIHVC